MGEMDAVGIGARRGMTILPASPLEILAYENMGQHFPTASAMAKSMHLSQGLDAVQSVFASTVLLNFNTPIKTHLDEVIRLIQDTGFNKDSVWRINNPFAAGARGARPSA